VCCGYIGRVVSGLDVVDQHTGQVGTVGTLQGDHEGGQTQVGGKVQLLDQRLEGRDGHTDDTL